MSRRIVYNPYVGQKKKGTTIIFAYLLELSDLVIVGF